MNAGETTAVAYAETAEDTAADTAAAGDGIIVTFIAMGLFTALLKQDRVINHAS